MVSHWHVSVYTFWEPTNQSGGGLSLAPRMPRRGCVPLVFGGTQQKQQYRIQKHVHKQMNMYIYIYIYICLHIYTYISLGAVAVNTQLLCLSGMSLGMYIYSIDTYELNK